MDAFYASVEQLDDPLLRGKPVIIGPNSMRGVCLTASYEARQFGVRSAMPMAEVRRRCPDVLPVPPRFERYQEISEKIMDVFSDFSPKVEAISLDEAFVDMTGAEGIFGEPLTMAQSIQTAIFEATGGLTASVGVSSTKYVAKVASDYDKPNGITIVPPADAVTWLDPMPVKRLWGAGPKTVPRLERLGLYTIGDVRRADSAWLKRHLGGLGLHFKSLANAEDPRRVARHRVARSMGSDRTLMEDVTSREEIQRHLRRSADRVGQRLRHKGFRTLGVRVKLKTNDFQLQTRQAQLPEPTDCSQNLFEVGCQLLDEFDHRLPYRLVGLAAYDFVTASDPQQLDLFASHRQSAVVEQTIDRITEKYGAGMISRAADLGSKRTLADVTPNLDFIEIEDD